MHEEVPPKTDATGRGHLAKEQQSRTMTCSTLSRKHTFDSHTAIETVFAMLIPSFQLFCSIMSLKNTIATAATAPIARAGCIAVQG